MQKEEKEMKLNPFHECVSAKEMVFCVEYVSNGFNIYQAAIKAGYSKNYAKSKSYLLMEKVGIKRLIKKLIKERNEKIFDSSIADEKEILEYWTNTMRGIIENPQGVPYKEYMESETNQMSFFDCIGSDERPVQNYKTVTQAMRMRASENLYEAQKGFINNTNTEITVTFEDEEDE